LKRSWVLWIRQLRWKLWLLSLRLLLNKTIQIIMIILMVDLHFYLFLMSAMIVIIRPVQTSEESLLWRCLTIIWCIRRRTSWSSNSCISNVNWIRCLWHLDLVVEATRVIESSELLVHTHITIWDTKVWVYGIDLMMRIIRNNIHLLLGSIYLIHHTIISFYESIEVYVGAHNNVPLLEKVLRKILGFEGHFVFLDFFKILLS